MDTDIYLIRVSAINKGKCTVQFRVSLVYYDGGHTKLPTGENPSFFLMAMRDERFLIPNNNANSTEDVYETDAESPLHQKITFENTMDEKWMKKNLRKYVSEVVSVSDFQPVTGKRTRGGAPVDINNERRLEKALYEVKCTDVKWMQHLKVGQVWRSAVFGMDDV